MSLEKAIQHHKEKRKPYIQAKAIDPHCRNHGQCTWCENNRQFFDKKRRIVADEKLKENKDVQD